MSMTGNYVGITSEQLASLLSAPEQIQRFLYPTDDSEPGVMSLDIDKAWDGIHYLLTQAFSDTDHPALYVVLGGLYVGNDQEEIFDVGYGPASYNDPDQVSFLNSALHQIGPDKLSQNYDPVAMQNANIYPEIWMDDDQALNYLIEHYHRLKDFFQQCTTRNLAMLKYLA